MDSRHLTTSDRTFFDMATDMAETERNQLLQDFQEAINQVTPQETQTLPSEQNNDPEIVEEIMAIPDSGPEPDMVRPSVSNSAAQRTRFSLISASPDLVAVDPRTNAWGETGHPITFRVSFQNQIQDFLIEEDESVGIFKTRIYARFGIRPCSQDLRYKGNPAEVFFGGDVNDATSLKNLSLPPFNHIIVLDHAEGSSNSDSQSERMDTYEERLGKTFMLTIRDLTHGKDYALKFPGTQTVSEVKNSIFQLTDIPARHQEWTGWPSSADDSTTLARAGIDLTHEFTLKETIRSSGSSSSSSNRKKLPPGNHKHPNVIDITSSDEDSDEVMEVVDSFSLEEDIFAPTSSQTSSRNPLIPPDADDEEASAITFSAEFSNRYGPCIPMWFHGTLDNALREATSQPAKDRKPLAIYLHHDGSILSNVFCSHALCTESIVSFLSSHFIIWGWDLTHESNRAKFLKQLNQHVGNLSSTMLWSMDVEKFPLLMVIGKNRASLEVSAVIHGNVSVDELMTRLIQAVDMFHEQQAIEAKEEYEREAREQVKREQDEAYHESLAADRAKEEARKQEEEKKFKQEQFEALEQQKARDFKEAVRQSLMDQLPEEPGEGCTEKVAALRFRVPHREVLYRRFLASNSLKDVLNYVTVEGYPPEEYKVLTSFPRRDLSQEETHKSLEELKLCPQETLTLEER